MRKAYLDISADEREKGKRDSGPAEIQKKKSRPPSHLEISLEKAKAEGDAEKIEFFQRQLDFLAGKAPLFSKDKKSEWPFPNRLLKKS